MRLIDADELKTAFPTCDNSKPVLVSCVRATINHMPTIEPTAQPLDVQEAYYKGKIDAFSECRALFVKSLNEETK